MFCVTGEPGTILPLTHFSPMIVPDQQFLCRVSAPRQHGNHFYIYPAAFDNKLINSIVSVVLVPSPKVALKELFSRGYFG